MKQESNFKLMLRMSSLVKPLTGYMILAITLGVTGFLCAIFIPYFASLLIAHIAIQAPDFPISVFFIIMGVCAILRGILHYGEQACNHYIAFKLLAILRDRVFSTLRRLCPAKLEGKDSGNLIFLITSDIEALEVFYAHTISPIFIAILTCLILLGMFLNLHPVFALIAFFAYCSIGILLPLYITKKGKADGKASRKEFGDLSDYTLESLRGMQDILQYEAGKEHLAGMQKRSMIVNERQKKLKHYEGVSMALANMAIMGFSCIMVLCAGWLYLLNEISFTSALMGSVLLLSSFGPVMALSNLSNNLLITMASARRVLHLLDEQEQVEEINGKQKVTFGDMCLQKVSFAYADEMILQDFHAVFEKGKITGILGKSGSGKSTLLKLLMRFWSVTQGQIHVNDTAIKDINTKDLRQMQGYVTQDTVLFHDSILNNIRIAKLNASIDEVEAACKKANIHDFIMSLPKDYATPVAELGESLSQGERQRIALARAFLHDAPCLLLDEPTSNLDALNEAAILSKLAEQRDKTIVLVSHRPSTLRFVDHLIQMKHTRSS